MAPVSPLSLASSSSSFESAVLLSRSRYRDRVVRRPWRRERRDRYYDEPSGWVALRGGFFDTDHVSKNDWLVGAKVTGQVARHLRLGVSVDLQRRSDAIREQIERYEDPAGNPVEASVTRFESASNLIPILGIIEVHPATGPLRPYLGVGAGYEALIVEVDDFETGIEFDDDYGGFGWQPYAGLEMPLSRNLALNGEVFGNFATVKRTVRDLDTGARVTEEIDLDGIGFRAGLSFGF